MRALTWVLLAAVALVGCSAQQPPGDRVVALLPGAWDVVDRVDLGEPAGTDGPVSFLLVEGAGSPEQASARLAESGLELVSAGTGGTWWFAVHGSDDLEVFVGDGPGFAASARGWPESEAAERFAAQTVEGRLVLVAFPPDR